MWPEPCSLTLLASVEVFVEKFCLLTAAIDLMMSSSSGFVSVSADDELLVSPSTSLGKRIARGLVTDELETLRDVEEVDVFIVVVDVREESFSRNFFDKIPSFTAMSSSSMSSLSVS